MEENYGLGCLQRSAVRELANIGVGHATTSLAEITGRPFSMSVPDAESVGLLHIPQYLGGSEALNVGIHMPIDGDVLGQIAFMLSWDSACALWEMVGLGAPSDLSDVDDYRASAMVEIGNIINSSFLSAISDMTDLRMEATPPQISIDMSAVILSDIISFASLNDYQALAIRTQIGDPERRVEGYFLFIPTIDGLARVFEKLGIGEAA